MPIITIEKAIEHLNRLLYSIHIDDDEYKSIKMAICVLKLIKCEKDVLNYTNNESEE